MSTKWQPVGNIKFLMINIASDRVANLYRDCISDD